MWNKKAFLQSCLGGERRLKEGGNEGETGKMNKVTLFPKGLQMETSLCL